MNERNSGGISLLSVLGIVFIVLKLCNVIDWDWIWVLFPFWLPFAIIGVGLVAYMLYNMVVLIMSNK